MEFQEICEDIVRQADGVLGCFLIDVRRGFVVAAAQRQHMEFEEAEIQSILRSSGELFRGALVEQFARSLPAGSDSPADFVREVQVTKAGSYQFMSTVSGWKDGLVILVAERTLSLGFGWMVLRQAKDQLSEALQLARSELRKPKASATPSSVARGNATQARSPQRQSQASQQQPQPAPEPALAPIPPVPPKAAAVKASAPQPAPARRAPPKASGVKAAEPPPEVEQEQEPDPPVVLGPRARMFHARSGKK